MRTSVGRLFRQRPPSTSFVVTSGGGGFFLEPTGCGVATEFFDDG